MKEVAYCLFETPLGWCGLAWSAGGKRPVVTLLRLSEATPAMTESRITQCCGGRQTSAPPAEIAEVIERVSKHLRGEVQDFRDVTVELAQTGLFARRFTKPREKSRRARPGRTARSPKLCAVPLRPERWDRPWEGIPSRSSSLAIEFWPQVVGPADSPLPADEQPS